MPSFISLSVAFLLLAFTLRAQEPSAKSPDWFPFTISAFDSTSSALDLSYLNEKPAGKHGFIHAQAEILTDDRGQPWRYFGTNFTAGSCFPSAEEAPKLAAHLAKCGFNLVRLHYLDENWTRMQLVRKDGQPGLDLVALERLDFFFAQLKKNGIYVNLNLHVGRTYPDQPKGSPEMSKGIDNIYPPYVAALQDYARALLTHVNPHTGLAYREDPAVAIVEVNNENTLLMNSFWPAKISGPVQQSILRQWQAWTTSVFQGDDSKIRAAWGTRPETPGPNLLMTENTLDQAANWRINQGGGSASTLSLAPEGQGVRLHITKVGTEHWHGQILHNVLPLVAGNHYRLRFRARAETERTLYTCTQQTDAPYETVGLWTNVTLTPAWQDFSFPFTATANAERRVSLNFGPSGQTGWSEFDQVYLDEYSDGYLPASSTLAGGVPLPDEKANKIVLEEYYRFLAATEISYAKEMHRFLKQDLHVKSLISHSHIAFGALLGVRREAIVSDVVHANAYWHHPEFPRKSWDPKDWLINQDVLSQQADGGILAELAVQRVAGKPFALTEWDIPAPIDSLAEGVPLLAAFASWQGWSGLTLYTFAHESSEFTDDHYQSFFNYHGHPGKRAGIPFAALLFRTGAVSPSKERTLFTLPSSALFADIAAQQGNIWSNWRRFYQSVGLDGSQALKRQTAITLTESAQVTATIQNASAKDSPAISEDGQLTWGSVDGAARVVSSKVIFASGSLGARSLSLGPCTLKTEFLNGDGFALCGLISLDDQPIITSNKLLGLALRRSENEGRIWQSDRRSLGDQWGHGPSLVLGYHASVTLPNSGKWSVTPLGPDGQPSGATYPPNSTWNITPADRTVWWLIEKTSEKTNP